MLPSLKIVKRGLRLTTEALAADMTPDQPTGATPVWSELEWRLASAVAVAHGVSPLLSQSSRWQNPGWKRFLADQRTHVEHRHERIAILLESIDHDARAMNLAIVPLKGAALHALGIYRPGERPMADIDLLVREEDVGQSIRLLIELGYEESFVVWKHRVFKPANGKPIVGLGEHRDTPINIELHTRIQERLPLTAVDITERIFPRSPRAGLNSYPSEGALMSHLLLHAAGNICHRSLRLLHLHDIARLSARLSAADWNALLDAHAAEGIWWALPPLHLVERYYAGSVPASVLERLELQCHPLLKLVSKHQTLTQVSCSELWHHTLQGVEWLRSLREFRHYIGNRVRPPDEARREYADMVRTQLWLQQKSWVTLSRGRRLLALLTRPLPRMDTLYVVRAALEASSQAV
jgi:hypothetical protein